MCGASSKGEKPMSCKKFQIIKEILIRAKKDFKSKDALETAMKLNKLSYKR